MWQKLKNTKTVAALGAMALALGVAIPVGAEEGNGVGDALDFSLDLTELGPAIGAALGSLWPIAVVPVGLIVGGAIISYAISLFQRFRGSGGRR